MANSRRRSRSKADIEKAGAKLAAPATLLGLFTDFLGWAPIAPRTAKQLAGIAARLCRLLREEVTEELDRNNPGLASLSSEWRNLLFPEATNKQFADGYAQAVTFGLLVARVRKIDLAGGLDHAATELRKVSGLIGTALRLLVDDENVKTALASALDTLRRVLNVVDWELLSKGDADAWLYFYEDFLEVYDNDLRKQTGSYYTPPQVVDAMVRLVDEALRDKSLFEQARRARREGRDDLRSGRWHRHLSARRAAPHRRDRRGGQGRRRRGGGSGKGRHAHVRLRDAVRPFRGRAIAA